MPEETNEPETLLKARLKALPHNRHGRRAGQVIIRRHFDAIEREKTQIRVDEANAFEASLTPGDRIRARHWANEEATQAAA